MPINPYSMEAPHLSEALSRRVDQWHDAMRWQRMVDQALRPRGITHSQFLLLHGAAQALEERQDAVSLGDIEDAANLDHATTVLLVRKLDARGYFDKGPHGLDARKYRIRMTHEGHVRLCQATIAVERVATDFCQ